MSPASSPAAVSMASCSAAAGNRKEFPLGAATSGGGSGSPLPLRHNASGGMGSQAPRRTATGSIIVSNSSSNNNTTASSNVNPSGKSSGSLGIASAGNSASSLGGRDSPSIPLLSRSFLGKQLSQFNIKKLRTGALPGEGLTAASMGYCRGGGIVRTKSTAAAEVVMAERKRELRLREINNDLVKGNDILRKEGVQQVDYLAFPCRYEVGTAVVTMFGEGVIVNFRSDDGIYEVLIEWEWRRYGSDSIGSVETALGKSLHPTGTKGIAMDNAGAPLGCVKEEGVDLQEIQATHETQDVRTRLSVDDQSGEDMVDADQLLDSSDAADCISTPRRGIRVFIAGVAIHTQY